MWEVTAMEDIEGRRRGLYVGNNARTDAGCPSLDSCNKMERSALIPLTDDVIQRSPRGLTMTSLVLWRLLSGKKQPSRVEVRRDLQTLEVRAVREIRMICAVS
jgi:hypothetical protein